MFRSWFQEVRTLASEHESAGRTFYSTQGRGAMEGLSRAARRKFAVW